MSNIKYKIIDIYGYAIITFFIILTEIYGIDNVKRLGDKLLKWADKKEKEKC